MIAHPSSAEASFRLRVAIVFGVLTGVYAAARAIHEPNWPTDFDQLWFAARALVRGDNPYSVVGPGRPFQWDWPLLYPLPAVLFAVPFTVFPVAIARVVFSTVAGAILGWSLGPRVRQLWPMVLSAAYLIATARTQWAPLLLAAAWIPWLGALVMAKPNVGLAAVAAQQDLRRDLVIALGGVIAIFVLSLAVRPDWIASWRGATASAPHVLAPILLPGGFLLALALLRWRRPEARLLFVLACLPHTPSLYDLVLLFVACRTLRETLALAVLTHALFWGFIAWGSGVTFDAYALNLGRASILVVYLPVLIAVVLRPNVYMDVPSPSLSLTGRQGYLPQTRVDLVLASLLLVGAVMLVWLPLATYR